MKITIIFLSCLISVAYLPAQVTCAGDTTIPGIFYRLVNKNHKTQDESPVLWHFVPASLMQGKMLATAILEDLYTEKKPVVFLAHPPEYPVVDSFLYIPNADCRTILRSVKEINNFPRHHLQEYKIKDTARTFYVQVFKANVNWLHLNVVKGTPVYKHPRTYFISRAGALVITDYYFPKKLLTKQKVILKKGIVQ